MSKKLSNPASTGNIGAHFEAHVQASYVTLMLTGGCAPSMPCWPITNIKLQGRIDGYETDDLIVLFRNPSDNEIRKLLCQVKHSIRITKGNNTFFEVIEAAWNDYNNPIIFNKGKDRIALICGQLNRTDFDTVHWILNQAKKTSDVNTFLRNIKQVNFSPSKCDEKLEVFRCHLERAAHKEITDNILYDFLQNFSVLGYDLGKEESVVLSLLQSHISLFKKNSPKLIWGRIVDFVQEWNHSSGELTLDKIPDDIKKLFEKKDVRIIPENLIIKEKEVTVTDWNNHKYASDLAVLNLIGKWNENVSKDLIVVDRIVQKDSSIWLRNIRDVLQLKDSCLSFVNGLWTIPERKILFNSLGSRLFDENLEIFKVVAIEVLSKINSIFELNPDERYLAGLEGKKEENSYLLKQGIVDGLALIFNESPVLRNVTTHLPERITWEVINELFKDSDWKLWASLNDLLPILAEANPDKFLEVVESAVEQQSCPFDELFAQEGNGITGSNYMTGLLWALEAMAWDESYLIRVCVILAKLAEKDPGGNWGNRPKNSLIHILLPWFPQTIASADKRNIAVKNVKNELPQVAWELVLKLLPDQHQTSSENHKPKWRNTIPVNWENKVTNDEYWKQIAFVADMAVELSKADIHRLCKLVDRFDNLPKQSFDKLLDVLSDNSITSLEEKERVAIWQNLTAFVNRHRKYSDTEWALSPELVNRIEEVSIKLKPVQPFYLHQYLFNQGFDLYEDDDNWEEQEEKLREKRKNAVGEIIKTTGIKSIIEFVKNVDNPSVVGNSLGLIGNKAIDKILLPDLLTTKEQKVRQLIEGYIWSRYFNKQWNWIDGINKSDWSLLQVCELLKSLPFQKGTWNRAEKWLGKEEGEYWRSVQPNPYHAIDDLDWAIEKFLTFKRPNEAINCLNAQRRRKKELAVENIFAALMMAASTKDFLKKLDVNDIRQLIEFLQQKEETNQDKLFEIEWIYIELFDYYHGATPITIQNRLASNAEFFCEIIQIMFKSDKTEEIIEPSEEKKSIGRRIWKLLRYWTIPPGLQKDKSFDSNHFIKWITKVRKDCIKSGHWSVAQMTIGDVLIHSPKDDDGLWIHRAIAAELNKVDSQDMRNSFSTALFNSRGAHFVAPDGSGEKALATKYRNMADEIEAEGFSRIATTLRDLAKSYDRDAERVIENHQNRKLYT